MLEWPISLRELITLFVRDRNPIGQLPVFFSQQQCPQNACTKACLRPCWWPVWSCLVPRGRAIICWRTLDCGGSFQVAGGITFPVRAEHWIFGDRNPRRKSKPGRADHLRAAVISVGHWPSTHHGCQCWRSSF